MGVTHIIRGEEWISSVPKHLQLYKYFGWETPQMAHLPLLLNSDKSKLSKRQGDVAVEDYIKKGYLPEAIINFVAFLGWNPGGERELYTLDELVGEFSLEKVGKAGAIFNLDKLNWFNKQYIKQLSDVRLLKLSLPYLESDEIISKLCKKHDDQMMIKALLLEKERVATLAELPGAIRFIFQLPDYNPNLLVWKKSEGKAIKKNLSVLGEFLNTIGVQEWNLANLNLRVGELIKNNNLTNGEILWPMRVALSGQENSPGPFEIANVLGKDECILRLNNALNML